MDTSVLDRLSRSLASPSSRRQVFKLTGAATLGALAVADLPGASARRRNPFENITVSGVNRAGKKVFVGKLDITRFVADGDTLYAVGSLSGRLIRRNRRRKINGKTVRIPVEAINGVDLTDAAQGVSAQKCRVLTLTLGPLDLNLLGLRVQLNQINLRITAIPGGGLLGDLLCAVANLLSGGLLGGILNQIARLLNRILDILG